MVGLISEMLSRFSSGDNLLIVDCKAESVSHVTSPGVVRFNPEILTSEGPEELAEDQGQEEKFLEREIIQYLQKYKYEDNKNLWPSKRGRVKKWNLVRQRFHENREVFFSGVPRVTQTTQLSSHQPHSGTESRVYSFCQLRIQRLEKVEGDGLEVDFSGRV